MRPIENSKPCEQYQVRAAPIITHQSDGSVSAEGMSPTDEKDYFFAAGSFSPAFVERATKRASELGLTLDDYLSQITRIIP